MRPIPAPRLGDTHGLLRAINQRDRVRLDEFITEFSDRGAVPARARERARPHAPVRLLRALRGAAQRGSGRRRADRGRQALRAQRRRGRGLRRLLRPGRVAAPPAVRASHDGLDLPRRRDRAVALRLEPAGLPRLPARLRPRARAPRPRGLGQREHAREPGRAVHDVPARPRAPRRPEPAHRDRHADEVGADAARPHVAARPRGPAQPGRARGGRGRGRGRVGRPEAARAGAGARGAGRRAEPEPVAEEEADEPVAPPAIDTGEYEDVAGARPAAEAAAAQPSGRPIPPSDIWETAAPDEVTRAYSAISPEQAAAAAVEGSGRRPARRADAADAAEEPAVEEEPAAVDAESAPSPGITSGDPLAGGVDLRRPPRPGAGRCRGPGSRVGRPRGRRRRAAAAEERAEAERAADDAPLPVVGLPAELAEEPDEADAATTTRPRPPRRPSPRPTLRSRPSRPRTRRTWQTAPRRRRSPPGCPRRPRAPARPAPQAPPRRSRPPRRCRSVTCGRAGRGSRGRRGRGAPGGAGGGGRRLRGRSAGRSARARGARGARRRCGPRGRLHARRPAASSTSRRSGPPPRATG